MFMFLPKEGDLVLVLFYNEGIRKQYYLGSCSSVIYPNSAPVITLIRAKDRSTFRFSTLSPTILGFKIVKIKKK